MTHKSNSIWCDSPGGLALQLSGRPKPATVAFPFLLKGVVDVPQRMAAALSTPLHFVGEENRVGGREKIKRVDNAEKERQRENNRSICCNGDEKSSRCQGKILRWWWKHWTVLLALVESSANESWGRKKKDWRRGIMRWSGLKRHPRFVQWGWERIREKVRHRYRSKPDSCIIADHIDWAGKKENYRLSWNQVLIDGRMTTVLYRRMKRSVFTVNGVWEQRSSRLCKRHPFIRRFT